MEMKRVFIDQCESVARSDKSEKSETKTEKYLKTHPSYIHSARLWLVNSLWLLAT